MDPVPGRSPATVSVVIPAYNRAATLRRALGSVTDQSRRPDEVIVVDDGSTDGTDTIVESGFPGVRLIRQANRGVSAARNRGIATATGEWIAFLDSDDEWKPDKLEKQLAALAAFPDAPLCHTNEVWIRNGRRVNEGRRHAKAGGRIFRHCLPLCVISPSSAVVRRSLFAEIGGFDESMPVCEDYDMWLRICARYPVAFVEEPLTVKYGGHSDQLSRSRPGLDRYRIAAIDRILDEGILETRDRAAAVRALLEKTGIYKNGAAKRGKEAEIKRCEALIRKYKPDLI